MFKYNKSMQWFPPLEWSFTFKIVYYEHTQLCSITSSCLPFISPHTIQISTTTGLDSPPGRAAEYIFCLISRTFNGCNVFAYENGKHFDSYLRANKGMIHETP